jgi:hypothetical protein
MFAFDFPNLRNLLKRLQDTPRSYRKTGEPGFELGTQRAAARATVTLDQIMMPAELGEGRGGAVVKVREREGDVASAHLAPWESHEPRRGATQDRYSSWSSANLHT